jgi:hypothetical protein
MMNTVDDKDLRAYVVFMPMLEIDDIAAAEARIEEFSDPRLTYFWDPGFTTGHAWRQVLALDDVAWDMYFIYGLDSEWGGQPTKPEYAMTGHHAIPDKVLKLDIDQFIGKVETALSPPKKSRTR